eukprot:1270055-Amphidinium_carterae.1
MSPGTGDFEHTDRMTKMMHVVMTPLYAPPRCGLAPIKVMRQTRMPSSLSSDGTHAGLVND